MPLIDCQYNPIRKEGECARLAAHAVRAAGGAQRRLAMRRPRSGYMEAVSDAGGGLTNQIAKRLRK